MNYFHHFYFIKLVLSKYTLYILTVRSRFSSKARSKSAVILRKFTFRKNFVLMKISQSNLCCGYQEHIISSLVCIILKFRKLTGSYHYFSFHQLRSKHLFVSVFTCMKIQHKINKGSFQFRSKSSIHCKS